MTATAPAARANGYAAACHSCKGWVPAGAGSLTKEGGRWVTRHTGECPPPRAPRAAAAQPELGYYVTAAGKGIKVVQSRSNPDRRYGLVFTPSPYAGKRPSWDYVKGAGYSVADLTPMGAADAAALGLATGHCIECLTKLGPKREDADPHKTPSPFVSALIGYGETCAANNSWPYPKGVAAQRAFLAEHGA